jgi:universal stress protein E
VTRPPIRTILVAVADPSSTTQPAVNRAKPLAKAWGARLVLFHGAFDPALSGRPFFDSKRLAKARGARVAECTRWLERQARALRAAGLKVDVHVVWEEPVHEAIIRAAIRVKAGLVIAGSHEPRSGRQPQWRLTDWELMRACPTPLLLAHPTSRALRTGVVLAALDPFHLNDKPASLDDAITCWATRMATALETECHAAHAIPMTAYPLGASAAERKEFDRRVQSRLERSLAKRAAAVKAVHIVHGSPNTALPELTRELPARVLVMGIISRRGLKRFVIGDTAETIVRDVMCDLLLIKPDNFRLRLGRSRKEPIVL